MTIDEAEIRRLQNIEFEHRGCQHLRERDNAELIAQRDRIRRETAEAIAADLTSQADDEAQRPNRDGTSRAIEEWLREAAKTALSYAEADRG